MLGPILAVAGSILSSVMGKQANDNNNAANATQVARMNEFNAAEAAKNRDFQERMSNTQWQRTVSDLTAAGLNPALAYQQGGAGAPSGSSASGGAATMTKNPLGDNMGRLVTNALEAKQAAANINATEMAAEKTRVETAQMVNSWQYDVALKVAERELKYQSWRFNEQSFADRIEQIKKEIALTTTNAAESGIRTNLLNLTLPEARNNAARQNDMFKKFVSPYMSDAKAAASILGDLKP